MNALQVEPNAWAGAFERFRAEDAGAEWLVPLREKALARFLERGLPTTREEDWRYTNLRPVGAHHFRRAPIMDTPTEGELEGNAIDLIDGPHLIFFNGSLDPRLSELTGLPAGVEMRSLQEALRNDRERLEPWIAAAHERSQFGPTDLNLAFFTDGAYIRVPKGVEVEIPLRVLFLTGPWQDAVVTHPRVIVDLEENSSLTLVERFEAQGPGERFTNAATQVRLAAGARLEHVRLQREGAPTHHLGDTHVAVGRDATYQQTAVSLGGATGRHGIHVDLLEEGACGTLNGVAVLGGREHVDTHSVLRHHVPHGTSRELYKHILGGQARAGFTGRIVVDVGAQKSDSEQANHNLLLSSDALASTRPQLEIYADDVVCAHGATVGQLDEEQLFFLRSRGLSYTAARNLLIHAFASEVISQIGNTELRQAVEKTLAARLSAES